MVWCVVEDNLSDRMLPETILQRRVSAKDGGDLDLTASLYLGPKRGSLGKAVTTIKVSTRWRSVFTPQTGL